MVTTGQDFTFFSHISPPQKKKNHISPKTDAQIELWGKILDCSLTNSQRLPWLVKTPGSTGPHLPPTSGQSLTFGPRDTSPLGCCPSSCPRSPRTGPGVIVLASLWARTTRAPVTHVESESRTHRYHTQAEAGTRPSNPRRCQPLLRRG